MRAFKEFNTVHVPRGEPNTVDYFAVMPGFDVESFPFIACSNAFGISLINLKQDKQETLIIA